MPRKGAGSAGRNRQAQAATAGSAMGVGQSRIIAPGQRFMAQLDEVAVNPRNIRESWEYQEDAFFEFAANLKAVGQLQDCVVCAIDVYIAKYPEYADHFGEEIRWVLITGERRYMAAKQNSQDTLPCVLRNDTVEMGDRSFMSENRQRKGLDPLTEGMLYLRIHDEEGLDFEQVALSLGESNLNKSGISKRVNLFQKFPEGEARKAIRRKELGIEPAYLLMTKLKEPALIEEAYAQMLREGITAKRVVSLLLAGPDPDPAPPAPPVAPSVPAAEAGAGADPGTEAEPEPKADGSENASPVSPTKLETGSRKTPATPDPVEAGASVPEPRTASDVGEQIENRLKAATAVLAERTYGEPDGTMQRIALEILSTVSESVLGLAVAIVGEGLSRFMENNSREQFVAGVFRGDKIQFVRLADAITLAGPEYELRTRPADEWGGRHRFYLKQLYEAGYVPSSQEEELLPVSSAKLTTPQILQEMT